MWTVQATRSTMSPMTDQLTAGPGSGDDAISSARSLGERPRVFNFRTERALLGRFRWEVKGTVDKIYRNIIDCIYLTNITLHPLLTARCPYSSSFDGAAKEKGGFPWVESARSSFRSGKVAADTPCCTR